MPCIRADLHTFGPTSRAGDVALLVPWPNWDTGKFLPQKQEIKDN